MLDWQRHEDELANARIAEDAVRSGRRTRRRQAALVATVAVVVALLGVGVPIALSSTPPRTLVTGEGTAVPAAQPRSRARPSRQALPFYLLVLAGPRIGAGGTIIPDRLCPGVATRPVLPCRGEEIPAQVQAAVRRADPKVRFVPDASWPQQPGDPTVVGFGALDVRGGRATLESQSLCGPLCGSGQHWEFVRRHGRWTVLRSTGGWIS